jgi:hypothetical protein
MGKKIKRCLKQNQQVVRGKGQKGIEMSHINKVRDFFRQWKKKKNDICLIVIFVLFFFSFLFERPQ